MTFKQWIETEDWGFDKSHDYDPNWDYLVSLRPNPEHVQLVAQIVNHLRTDLLPRLKLFRNFEVHILKNGELKGELGKYAWGTYTHPVIMLDMLACERSATKYRLSLNLAVTTTILHELGHAIQEAKGLDMDEGEAERFAHDYFKYGDIISFRDTPV